jgi:hypothetical protein
MTLCAVLQAPSRLQLLEDELKRAQEATGEWLDADLMKGFVQRERRLEVYTYTYIHYIMYVLCCLNSSPDAQVDMYSPAPN